jgi:hypothetical protein
MVAATGHRLVSGDDVTRTEGWIAHGQPTIVTGTPDMRTALFASLGAISAPIAARRAALMMMALQSLAAAAWEIVGTTSPHPDMRHAGSTGIVQDVAYRSQSSLPAFLRLA